MNGIIDNIKLFLMQSWDGLKEQLQVRLEPAIESLRPIWSDPLWQFLGLIVALVLILVVLVLIVRLFSGALAPLLDGLRTLLMMPWKGLKKLFAAISGRVQQREQQVQQRSSWLRNARLLEGLDAIRYLTTKRDWRYKTSWYLLSGCQDSDKHAWVDAQQEGRRAQLLARERQLVAAGSQWHFFDQGVIIDPDHDADYSGTINLLTCFRPERPVDGLILTISAKSLLDATNPSDQKELGEQLYRQMWDLQKVTGFVVPVYLLVTRCDQVDGFQALWASQPDYRLHEMFGWSNPARLDTAFHSNWVADAFGQVSEGIQKAQLQAAASGQDIADVDSFMLFDQQFQALQAPLQKVIDTAFARSSFQEPLPLRGIWFNGLVNGEPVLSRDFLAQKLWPETHLAYPIEKRRFSTNKILRRFQFITGTIAIVGVLMLIMDSVRLHSYTNTVQSHFEDVRNAAMDCNAETAEDPGAKMWWMLTKLTQMGQQPMTLSIPAFWFGGQRQELVDAAAKLIYPEKIFKDMECQLAKRGADLKSSGANASNVIDEDTDDSDKIAVYEEKLAEANEFMDRLSLYQQAEETFVSLAGPLPSSKGVAEKFRDLLDYLYDSSIPPIINFNSPLIETAVAEMSYDVEASVQLDHGVLIGNLNSHTEQVYDAIQDALRPPLTELQRTFSPDNSQLRGLRDITEHGEEMIQAIEHFDTWVNHIYYEWLVTEPHSSPCGRMNIKSQTLIRQLDAAGYSRRELEQAVAKFSKETCDTSARHTLDVLNGDLFGDLFVSTNDGKLGFSQGLARWQQQMQALEGLSIISREFQFTQAELDRAGDISALDMIDQTISEGKVVAWMLAPVIDAIDLVLSYQSFKQRWWMTDSGIVEPFYAAALQHRMVLLVEAMIQRAMVRETASSPAPLAHDRDMEAQLAQRVGSFQKASTSIRQLILLLEQEGYNSNSISLNRSSRDFVQLQLQDLWTLVVEDRLYSALPSPDWQQENFAYAMLGYNDAADIDSYLDHQRQRTAYLAQHYARPLVSYLVDNGGVAQTDVNAQRWIDTIRDLRRYERKESGSNVRQIEQFVTDKLLTLNVAACNTWLQTPGFTYNGNSVFATRQAKLDQLSRSHCQSSGKQGVIKQYLELAERFNVDLANRFPFAALDNNSQPEVSIEVVNQFFRDYQASWAAGENRAGLYADLQALAKAQPKLVSEDWLKFVARLDQLSRFWNQVASADNTVQLALAVDFAALPEQSLGIRQIVQWELSSGSSQLSYPNGGNTISWSPGDRLALGLRWASGSSYRPVRSLKMPVQIDEAQRRALFVSRSRWSLFEWLQRFADAKNSQPQANLLSFRIPVIETQSGPTDPQANAPAQPAGSAPVSPLAFITRANLLLSYVVTAKDGTKQQYKLPTDLPRFAPDLADQKN